jgi:hypothetical protein
VLLLFDGAVCNRPEDVRIEPRVACDLLRIDLIAFAIAVRDRPQLAHVRNNHFMAKLLQLLADPDRVNARLHRNTSVRHINEPLLDGLRCGPEPASIDHFTLLVEGAVMAPNVAKVDADRQLYLATFPGCFYDEVLRWLLHGNSLLLLRRTCSSHLSLPSPPMSEHDSRISRRYWRLRLRFGGELRVIERVYSFDFSVYDVDPIKDVIHAVHRLHVEKSCNVISLDDMLLQLDACDHRQDTR